MNPEKRDLINDLLGNSDAQMRRAATLSAGGKLMGRKRWRRAAIRTGGAALIFVIAAVCICVQIFPQHQRRVKSRATNPAVTYLTDEQLLALFPNTPVGLATVDHRKVLIFPQASDRKRYVGQF